MKSRKLPHEEVMMLAVLPGPPNDVLTGTCVKARNKTQEIGCLTKQQGVRGQVVLKILDQ